MTDNHKPNESNLTCYTFAALTSQLILITWQRTPFIHEAQIFIHALQDMLDQATEPLYFISDLRRGRIVDIRIIQQLSQLTHHPQWGGSTAFSQNLLSTMFLANFERMLVKTADKNNFFDQPEQAIAFLEQLAPGLGKDIDWTNILKGSGHDIEIQE